MLCFILGSKLTNIYILSQFYRHYRFKSPRNLSTLLMSNEGGCDYKYPGIGNIEYVKDLISRKIKTRNFNCSQFGTSGLGLVCMSTCGRAKLHSALIGEGYILIHSGSGLLVPFERKLMSN